MNVHACFVTVEEGNKSVCFGYGYLIVYDFIKHG